MSSNTDLKLAKAKYCLNRMKEAQNGPDDPDFICELESFLMHANSVTSLPAPRRPGRNAFFLEQEVAERNAEKVPAFQVWYDQKVSELQGNPIMRFLREERNIAVHYSGSEVHSTRQYVLKMSYTDYTSVPDDVEMRSVYVDMPENATLVMRMLPSVPLVAGKPVQITIEHPKHVWLFNTDKITGDKEVISVCEQYIGILESVLEDCHKHGFL